MRNIHDPNEYHKYKSTTDNNHKDFNLGGGPGIIVIVIVILMLIFFIFQGTSWEAIETLLSLGLIAFVLAKLLFG